MYDIRAIVLFSYSSVLTLCVCVCASGYTSEEICIFAIDTVEARLAAAQRWGATPLKLDLSITPTPTPTPTRCPTEEATHSSTNDFRTGTQDQLSELIRAVSTKNNRSGTGADAVIECVGAYTALEMAYHLVASGGTISSVGVHHGEFPFTPPQAYDKNITYRTGRCPARSMMPIAEKLLVLGKKGSPVATGTSESSTDVAVKDDGERVVMKDIITHRFHLRDGKLAYEIFDKKQDGCLKPVMYPEAFSHLVV